MRREADVLRYDIGNLLLQTVPWGFPLTTACSHKHVTPGPFFAKSWLLRGGELGRVGVTRTSRVVGVSLSKVMANQSGNSNNDVIDISPPLPTIPRQKSVSQFPSFTKRALSQSSRY